MRRGCEFAMLYSEDSRARSTLKLLNSCLASSTSAFCKMQWHTTHPSRSHQFRYCEHVHCGQYCSELGPTCCAYSTWNFNIWALHHAGSAYKVDYDVSKELLEGSALHTDGLWLMDMHSGHAELLVLLWTLSANLASALQPDTETLQSSFTRKSQSCFNWLSKPKVRFWFEALCLDCIVVPAVKQRQWALYEHAACWHIRCNGCQLGGFQPCRGYLKPYDIASKF